MPLDRSRGNTPATPQLAELSAATVGVGLMYSMNGLAFAFPARLAPASNAATPRRVHTVDGDERSARWLWWQRTLQYILASSGSDHMGCARYRFSNARSSPTLIDETQLIARMGHDFGN